MAGCCSCFVQFSLWEQMVKAYKCMSEILSVTHTYKDPADGIRKQSIMDISRLEEQYYCTQQKQKLQTHIIVFKAGENEFISGEPFVNTVPVNKKVKKIKAFKEQTPVKEVTLELLDKSYLKERNGTWHAHLNIHRMVQLDCQRALKKGTGEQEKVIDKSLLFDRLLSSGSQPTKEPEHSTGDMGPSEGTEGNNSVSSTYRKSSLKQSAPALWSHYQFPSSKPTSPTEKVFYYPFPQKKNPRISETARKLGLYVTH
ncbi:uncharacterized protein C9orf152 homolog [Pseudophryne corroboree]|uniref:uncharacterized protein C9orf152 homolog n=1 Tax=Pseudophryne corroboree TaxID=495146 RepID=UPI0030812E19